ncbi:hypothetical protein DVH24_041399, partial [Malus domestica]
HQKLQSQKSSSISIHRDCNPHLFNHNHNSPGTGVAWIGRFLCLVHFGGLFACYKVLSTCECVCQRSSRTMFGLGDIFCPCYLQACASWILKCTQTNYSCLHG